jgi:hypothetical protein
MDSLIDILEIIIPSGIVFATAYYLVKKFLDSESNKNVIQSKSVNSQVITPIRLQAYERMALFLERISPNTLVMRLHKNGMSAALLHSELLKTIRAEYEHNLSQQIYMSIDAWEMIKKSKEETIKLVNLCAAKVGDKANGMDLSQFIIEAGSKIQKLPTQSALDFIKKEISQTF